MNLSIRPTRRAAAGAAAAAALATLGTTLALTSAASASPRSASAVIGKCTAGDLGVWVAADQSDGAAGSIYFPLEFTNLSSQTCYMYGYPGVSAVTSSGHQLGAAASRDNAVAPRIVNVAPGGTAHTVLRYIDAQLTPQCKPATAAKLSVYPPDQTANTHAFWDLPGCSTATPSYLSVEVIQPGPGTRP